MPPSDRDGAKQKALRIGVRMALTPVEEFPNWDPTKKRLTNPTFWEQYAAAAHGVLWVSCKHERSYKLRSTSRRMDTLQKKIRQEVL